MKIQTGKLNIFALTLIISLLVIVALNLLMNKYFYRFDLTNNKINSLANASKVSVRDLTEPIDIKVYFSKNLPPEAVLIKSQITELLNEYSGYSRNLRVKFVDPGDGVEAEKYGLIKVNVNNVKKDKIEVASGYMGMVIERGNRQEVIPVIKDADSLEYKITTAIKKVSTTRLKKIAFVSSQGCDYQSYQILREELSKIYEVKTVNLKKDKLTDYDLIIIASPQEEFDKPSFEKLNSYLLAGKSVVVFYDQYRMSQSLTPVNNTTNLNTWLASYGLTVGQELILDRASGLAAFEQGNMSFNVAYPYWLKITNDRFDSTNSAVADLTDVVLPWASAVTYQKPYQTSNDYVPILKTTTEAWQAATGSYSLSPESLPQVSQIKEFPLGYTLTGPLYTKSGKKTADSAHLIVLGDSDFAKDQFVDKNPANLYLALNLIDSASLDNSLAEIRAKNITSHPIKELTDQEKTYLRYSNLFGVSILVVVAGLLKFYFRRKNKYIEF